MAAVAALSLTLSGFVPTATFAKGGGHGGDHNNGSHHHGGGNGGHHHGGHHHGGHNNNGSGNGGHHHSGGNGGHHHGGHHHGPKPHNPPHEPNPNPEKPRPHNSGGTNFTTGQDGCDNQQLASSWLGRVIARCEQPLPAPSHPPITCIGKYGPTCADPVVGNFNGL